MNFIVKTVAADILAPVGYDIELVGLFKEPIAFAAQYVSGFAEHY
ncbi:MAG TPA: hypothetical protein PKL31_01175 [Fulvivirga sp.]|nr:hypothetical protein [Fulvivirga sp.]